MEEKYKDQIKYLDRKIDKIKFWVGRLSENESREEWGLTLLNDQKMMIELRDCLKEKHFPIEVTPTRTLIRSEDFISILRDTSTKEYFFKRMYFNFIESQSIDEIEKHIEITTLHGKDRSYKDVIVKANWKSK